MATTITIDTGSAQLVITANRMPWRPGYDYPMPTQETFGGAILGADLGDGTLWERPPFLFRRLTDAQWTTLYEYVRDDMVFATNPVTITDGFGNSHTNMVYRRGLETFERTQEGWSGTLFFAKDMSL